MSRHLLTRSLAANAGFSAATGVVLLAASAPLSRWLEIPRWSTIAVGLGLLPFAGWVAVTAREPRREMVRLVIFSDLAWVSIAIIVLTLYQGFMSTTGLWALVVVTVVVADFAILQTIGLRRAARSAGPR